MHFQLLNIVRIMSHRLNRIAMKQGSMPFTDLPYRLNIRQGTQLIVRVHKRHKAPFLSYELLQMGKVNISLTINVYIAQPDLSLFLQVLQGVQYRMMLRLCRNSMFDTIARNSRPDSRII